MLYSTEQKVFIVEQYFATKNAWEVARLVSRHFNIPPPHHKTILSIVKKFYQTGSVQNLSKTRENNVLTENTTVRILEHFQKNPKTTRNSKFNLLFEIIRLILSFSQNILLTDIP